MITLFDTHFHYYGEIPPGEFVAELPEQYRWKLLLAGGSLKDGLMIRDFAREIPCAWFAAGVHPHEAEEFDGGLELFDELSRDPRMVAAGELGLDYFYDYSPRQRQRQVLELFLERALAWGRPAILHCRDGEGRWDAYEDAYRLLRDFAASGGRFEVHCFTGTPGWAEKFLALGAYLGVTGMVTFPKSVNIRENLKVIPLERLLLETDAPFLAPVPYRGRDNHPKYLVEILKRVAQEYAVSEEELAAVTTANGEKLFGV